MKDYKRLTFKSLVDPYDDDCEETENATAASYDELLNRLAELEDKIENGTLRELPKIGQTLYGVIPWRKEVREITIDNIGVFSDCIVVFDTYDNDYVLNDYAFYTEAEAQKKLKECKK